MDSPITPRVRRPRTRINPPITDALPLPQEPVSSGYVTAGSTRPSPLTMGLVIIILIAAIGLGVKGLLTKKSWSSSGTAAPSSAALPAADVQALVQKVAAHIIVKTGETPTIATVQDPDVLRAQSPVFYKDAQVGDRLLIWSDKAVLYSTSMDKILAVLPINMTAGASATSTPATADATVLEVRNGSGIAGLGKTAATALKADGFAHILTPTDATSKTVYPHSVIIASPKATASAISLLQQSTGAQVTTLAADEKALKGDLLYIIGADAKK